MKILITGVSKGLGLALTKQYLSQGDTVYGISRNRPEIKSNKFHFLSFDLGQIDSLYHELVEFLEGVELDTVILNAGMLSKIKPLEDCKLWEIVECMTVNTWSNKVIIDFVLSQVNNICVITSGAGFRPIAGMNAYCLSKATLNMLIKLYGAEHPEVRFNLIDPGRMDTDMQSRLKERYTKDETAPVRQDFILNPPKAVAKRIIEIIK